MEVLFSNRKILRLTGPKVEHGSHDIKRIPHTQYDFVRQKADLLAQWKVRLDEPALIIHFALATEAIKLQAIVQSVIQVAIWTSVNASNLLEITTKESIARPRVACICDFIWQDATVEEGRRSDLF